MKNLTKEQMIVLKRKLNEYLENFKSRNNVDNTRERALTIFSTVFGEKSVEYERFLHIGQYSWGAGGYTDIDIQTFVSQIEGVLDCFDVFET